MDIQAEKLELVRMILDTDNPKVLLSIKQFFVKSKETDFWKNLPQWQRDDILSGVEEVDKGETVNYAEFIKDHQ